MHQPHTSYNRLFFILLAGWFFINLIQGIFTEINADEAYYALYGKNLDWGYFDHPPLVGVLNYLSAQFFNGNLGARFFTILLQPLTLLIVWKIISKKDDEKKAIIHFFIIAASLVMFSVYGFITTPDVPLLFFTALFLLSYKNFLFQSNIKTTALMALSMAGLIYSKYQGAILIILVVLSNFKLLKNIKFWIAGIVALMLVSPHFYWQYSNHFPSFRYHLVERSAGFKWNYFFEYLPNQLAVFNPFTFGAVVYLLFSKKTSDDFVRTLYFIIIGFIAFFALTTFRGHAEPHWTVAASIPMIILLTEASMENEKLSRYIKKYVGWSLLLVLMARILLVSGLLPERIGFNGKKEKIEAIHNIAGDCPVVFTGSFQNPSLYNFFTCNESTVISSLYSRQTQFDLWRKEEGMKGKKVFVAVGAEGQSVKYASGKTEVEGFFTNDLQTTNQLEIIYSLPKLEFTEGDSIVIPVSIINHSRNSFQMNHHEFPAEIKAVFIDDKEPVLYTATLNEPIEKINGGQKIQRDITFKLNDLKKGKQIFGLSFTSVFGPTINSSPVKIEIR